MPRYKLTIAYDGTDFCGWQKQEPYVGVPGGHAGGEHLGGGELLESVDPHSAAVDPRAPTPPVRRPTDPPVGIKSEIQGVVRRAGEDRARLQLRTVQHVVERAVREIVHEPVNVLGASRTDAGVHARGQVAAFTCGGDELAAGGPGADAGASTEDTEGRAVTVQTSHTGWPVSRGVDKLVRAINGKLPEDVIVTAAEPVAAEFDPVIGARSKAYSYTLHVSRTRPIWDRRFVHQVWDELDLSRMREAAARIVGEHDFAAFAAAGHGRLTTVRTVFTCDATEAPAVDGERRIRIDVSGSGFLYNMVRIIAGTLVECGRGRMTADDVARAIESKDRRKAGPTMPASGLCLEWIRYA